MRACWLVVFLVSLVSTEYSNTLAFSQPESRMSSTEATDTMFGKFRISSRSIFYRSQVPAGNRATIGFVNLRPIVPGHVLLIPERIVPYLEDLNDDEYVDLWRSVRVVQNMLKVHYKATAFNVAVQDGQAAGQSVPHVHVHILPRIVGDYERNDDIYDDIQDWSPRKKEECERAKSKLDVPNDEDRKDRTPEQMADEAELYRNVFRSLS